MKPVVGTEFLPGATRRRHRVRASTRVHSDGTEAEVGPGDAYVIEPGHDAWVVGDEAVVAFEFESAETYAR